MRGSELARRHARSERKRERRQRLRALHVLAGPPESAVMPAEQSHVTLALRVFTWFQKPVKSARK